MITSNEWVTELNSGMVHDPTIVAWKNQYYEYSTDTSIDDQPTSGVQIRQSTDLVHWQYVGQAMSEIPEEVVAWTGATGLWAPEVVQVGMQWRMYFAASTFGSRRSVIGLATASQPQGPFTYQGMVVRTDGDRDEMNAIDANVVTTPEGEQWLSYGSFFGGIHVLPLAPSGMAQRKGDHGKLIAKRPPVINNGAIEGPFIYYRPETKFYYLFVSYDSLVYSYNIRVGRSRSITGPYLDYRGADLRCESAFHADNIGNKLLGSYGFSDVDSPTLAPGHCSVLLDHGQTYLVHHVRQTAGGPSYGMVRRLMWTEDGWPVCGPNNVATPLSITYPAVNSWQGQSLELIHFTPSVDPVLSVKMTWPDAASVGDRPGCYSIDGLGQAVIWQEFDWQQQQMVTVVSGLDEAGFGFMGKTRAATAQSNKKELDD